MVRTSSEKLADQFLLLYLINDVSKRTPFVPQTKIQKLVFISEREMLRNDEKGFNYYFIKLLYGPYSPELDNDLNSLVQLEIIGAEPTGRGAKIISTRRCRNILKDFNDLIERNQIFVQKISEINRRFGILGFKRLLKAVHHMQSPLHKYRKGKRPPTIASLPLKAPLLKCIPEDMASETFSITPEEIATLEIYFDTEAYESLVEASKSAKEKRLLRFKEVF